jgi:hypothetical protein
VEHIDIIQQVCSLIEKGNTSQAKDLITKDYKHKYIKYNTRNMTVYEKLKIFIDDGFIDRYSGKKLLFPNVLRIITTEIPEAFPFHKNWKMSDCHIAYWEMMPTYDHILPIARGGKDIPENIATTSQMMNSIKSNFTLDEIGLKLLPKGSFGNWDGMIGWYERYIENHKEFLNDVYVMQWHKALIRIKKESVEQSLQLD